MHTSKELEKTSNSDIRTPAAAARDLKDIDANYNTECTYVSIDHVTSFQSRLCTL